MFAIRSLNLKVLSLAAAVAAVNGSTFAGPPKGGNGGNGVNGGISMSKSMPNGGGFKPQGSGVSNGGIKIDPGKGNGPVGNGGIKIDPGKGNGMPGGMGQGQGKNQGGMSQGNKPWMQKPQNGQNTIYCNTKFDPSYCQKYGCKTSYGYCYKGFDHNNWYCRSYSPKCGCWFYYDQCCSSWYYYCEQDVCYYPCSYLPYKTYCTPVCTTPVCTTVAVPYTYTVPVVTTVPVTTYQQVVTYKTVTGYQNVETYGSANSYQQPVGYGNVGGYQASGGPIAQSNGPQGPQGPQGPGGAGQMKLPALPGE